MEKPTKPTTRNGRTAVYIARLPHGIDQPEKMWHGDAGYDVHASIPETIQLYPGDIQVIPLGFKMELPNGYEAQLRPRSGLAKKGLTMPNAPGTIDAGYRGEVKCIMQNLGPDTIEIKPGSRVAQMVIKEVPNVALVYTAVHDLSDSTRGSDGMGSTGS